MVPSRRHHYAYTWDATTSRFARYLDGVLVGGNDVPARSYPHMETWGELEPRLKQLLLARLPLDLCPLNFELEYLVVLRAHIHEQLLRPKQYLFYNFFSFINVLYYLS